MSRGRLEAFTDAVLAVVITIMVLDLRPPGGESLADLRPLLPKLAVYLLSFVFVAIYWNNHHHMFQVVSRISGGVLWANAHLLFWLSLTPVAAAWWDHTSVTPLQLRCTASSYLAPQLRTRS